MSKRKLQISKNKIDEYIKKHHNDLLQEHSANLSTFIQETFYFELDDEKLYTVKRILKRKSQQYLIK